MRYSPFVRFIDRFLGSAICLFFTIIHKLFPRAKDRTIRNVLVIELVEMGASIMAYSSLRYLRKTIPNVQLYCLCLESTKASWLLLPEIPQEHVFAIDDRNFVAFALSLLKQRRAIAKANIDMVIDYELFLRISSIIAFLIRTKFRAGFYRYTMEGLYRGNFYDVKCSFNQNMHIAKNLLALTKSAVPMSTKYYNFEGPILNAEIEIPRYTLDSTTREAVKEKLGRLPAYAAQPIILIAPTVGHMMSIRDYPKEFYIDVIRELLDTYPKHLVLLIGTSAHRQTCEYIQNAVKDARCATFAGQTATLRELFELMTMADLLISNDSGNPHFAAMVGLKCLAIFGPETPFVYGPLGKAVCLYSYYHSSPTLTAFNHKNDASLSDASLRAIQPATVIEMAKRLMDGKAKYGTVNSETPYLI